MMKIYARLAAAVLIACFSAGLSACNSFHSGCMSTLLRLRRVPGRRPNPPATINCAGRSTCLPMGKVPKAGGSPGRW